MFLSSSCIRALIRKHDPPLVTFPVDSEDEHARIVVRKDFIANVNRIEGGAFELRLNRVFVQDRMTSSFYGISERRVPSPDEWVPDEANTWRLHSGAYILQSFEHLNMPAGIVGIIRTRQSITQGAGFIVASIAHPGYSGVINVGMLVPSGHSIKFERGVRFIQVQFGRLDGETDGYQGIWGGDRVGTDGKKVRAW